MSLSTQEKIERLRWVLPEAYWGWVADAWFYLTSPGDAALIRQSRKLQGRHRDQKRCFVIGSGPSLKTQDLKPLKNEFTVVANSFFQHPDTGIISPRYCCVGDPGFFAGHDQSVEWLRKMERALPSATLVFRPAAKPLLDQHGLFRNREVYFSAPGVSAKTVNHAHVDFGRPMNVGHSTGTSLCIPLALYLGFKEIYLLGYDADWLFQPPSASFHFYDKNPHFPKFDTFSSMSLSIEEELHALYFEFRSHRLLKEVAERMGVRIFNATQGGALDMYPRISYETLF